MTNWFKILLLLYACASALPAQDSISFEPEIIEETIGTTETVPEEQARPPRPAAPVARREVPESKWEKAAGDLDFSKDQPDEPKQTQPSPNIPTLNADWAFWGKLLQILAISIVVLGLGYVIYRMLQEPPNRQIARDGATITFDNVEDYLHESDLDRFLREALAAGNFSLALRFRFLQILKALSEKQLIHWSREKTNRDYLREMRPHRLYSDFKETTRIYERIWYGNTVIDATEFARIEIPFNNLKQQL
jgi:Domain of unknown function (DUF4129)